MMDVLKKSSWLKYALFAILAIYAGDLYGQIKESKDDLFGAGVYQEVNGLVKSRNVLGAEYVHDRRTFELGLLVNHFEGVSGLVFRHQYFLNRTKGDRDYDLVEYDVRPYLIYNFIYNPGISDHYLRHQVGEGFLPEGQQLSAVPTFNTIEHYLGIGVEADLVPGVYLNAYAGGGLFFYRHDSKMVQKNDMLLPEQTMGFNWNLSAGVGYRF